ncbi:SusD family protein [Bacteroidales bacterium Barb6XT]|nr:SusD family protein [Bacteroidales bacterium Barb6XT]
MKQFKYTTLSLLIVVSALFAGCSEDYLATNPTDRISDATVFASPENLRTALNGIHRKMVAQDGSSQGMGGEPGYIVCREALGDDMTWGGAGTWHKPLLQWVNHRVGTNSYNYLPWRIYYGWILNANFILENIDLYEESNPALYKGLKGEALCFRAFSHFNLVQMYAGRFQAGEANSQLGVPYRKSSEVTPMARHTVAECYQFINDDIDLAIQLLEGYKPETASNAVRENHFTQETAYGLKARIALAQQDYAKAAEAATTALRLATARGYALMTGNELMHGFSKITNDTKEAMWAAMTKSDQTVYFYSFYAYMSWNYNSTAIRQGVKAISMGTYDLMSPTDLRRQWWDPTKSKEGLPTTAFDPYVGQNRKFKAVSDADAVGDYAFMRIAELYLMKAEALARSGRDAEAQAVLTEFALTRDPAYQSAGNTGEALAEEIMTHRRIELWGEGFRWYDLKRLNQPLKRVGSNWDEAFCLVLEVPAGDPRWVYAIPQEELDANPLMVRND